MIVREYDPYLALAGQSVALSHRLILHRRAIGPLPSSLRRSWIVAASSAWNGVECAELGPTAADSGGFALPAGGLVLEDLEHDLIRQALDRAGGRIKEAADLLGLTYKTLQYRLKKHGIETKKP